MPKTLNKKEFIKAKAQGLNNTEAALKAGSKNKASAKVSGYNLAHSVDIQAQLTNELLKQDITLANALKPISLGLNAGETITTYATTESGTTLYNDDGTPVIKKEEFIPNLGVQLRASAMALDLLGVKKLDNSPTPDNSTNSKEIQKALKNGDEVELQRILFKKRD